MSLIFAVVESVEAMVALRVWSLQNESLIELQLQSSSAEYFKNVFSLISVCTFDSCDLSLFLHGQFH